MRTPPPKSEWLHGSLAQDGFRVQQIRFFAGRDESLSQYLSPNTLALAVVFSGHQSLVFRNTRLEVTADHGAILQPQSGLYWTASGGRNHRMVLVELGEKMLVRLRGMGDHATPVSEEALNHPLFLEPKEFTVPASVLSLAQQLATPPTHTACLPVWYQAKVTELASLTLFKPIMQPGETSTMEVNRERVDKAVFLLERDLENPPTLQMLAREVGCGPFYLSRLFASQMGRTIPELLRQRRMELAAKLLSTSRESISNIALRVGYESFSAFTRGFVREFGVTPSGYRKRCRQVA